MEPRKILVTGATGKQGGAVIKALISDPPAFPYRILGLTRNTASAAAQLLASKPNVELIAGDLDDCPAIFEAAGGAGSIWGVFSVQLPARGKNVAKDREEKQGFALVDAAVANGVSHFVYSSVDRGGSDSDNDPTNVPHFVSKYDIEKHLEDKAGSGMSWTILRPVAFMDNLTADMMGSGFAAMWKKMGNVKLQLVSTTDIGRFAAMAFSDIDEFKNKAISLAGDELTQPEGSEVFWKVFGKTMPRSFDFMASVLQYMITELGLMFRWFVDVGYKADIAECQRLNPKMQDLEAWLREESKFKPLW